LARFGLAHGSFARPLAGRVALASLGAAAIVALTAQPAMAHHEGTPSSVSLVAERSSVTTGETIRLTAAADRHLYGTPYVVDVVDEEGRNDWNACPQTPCTVSAGTPWSDNANPQPRHFHAELIGPGGTVVARSGQVTVDVRKFMWTVVSVVPNPATKVVPGYVQFLATLDRTVYGTGYQVYMYDQDNPAVPITCSASVWCSRSIARQWADNVNPKPGRVRVEVRGPSGDLASNTMEASATFRRFIFTVNLSFSTQTDASGNVVHKAYASTATTDPSLYGTPYQIKIRKADGTQVCSSPQVGCTATVAVGNTYRAVVEDSNGRNFGDSGSWTLADSGPRNEVVDGVDLALLAGAGLTGQHICDTALVAGGPSTDGDSVPDDYEVCEVSLGRGATVLQILRDIAVVGGGLAVIHILYGEHIAPTFSPGTTPDEWETMIAPPLPAPQQSREDKLADRLQVSNPELSAPEANAVARQCLYLLAKRGLNGAAECQSFPIFASGSDVPAATRHDLKALKSWLPWMQLNYDGRGSSKPGDQWYRSVTPCNQEYDGTVVNCHEFPFFSTLQGGPSPVGGRQPVIDLISAIDNQDQGRFLLNRFYRKCGIQGRVDNPEFLNIPLPPTGPIPTLGVCNGFN
jgi:hypothetical protein